MLRVKRNGALVLAALFAASATSFAAPPPFAIDVKELDKQKPAKPETRHKQEKKAKPAAEASGAGKGSGEEGGDHLRYTVKPGDHIFKILMGPFGMSEDAAERLIPEIVRVNKIHDIRKLQVGQTLLIPGKGHREQAAHPAKKERSVHREERKRVGKGGGEETAAPPRAPEPVQEPAPCPAPVPEPGPAPAPAAAPAPVPAPPAPVPAPMPVPPAVPVVPSAPAPPAQAAPAIPPAATWVCSVTERDPAAMVDALLNALSLSWEKNKILESKDGAATAFSIRVDRYFEHRGSRYIVSTGETDAYSYTLLRLLESAGYRVLRVTEKDDFHTVAEKLLRLMGLTPNFGKHPVPEGGAVTGFLVEQDDAGGRRVVLSGEPAAPRMKWLLAPGCGARK